jgi:hypothetical protein
MDYEIGARRCRKRSNARKRPRDRIVAVLERIARRQPASGVAEHQNALRIGTHQRQRLALEHAGHRARRHRDLAAANLELHRLDVVELLVRLRAYRHRRRRPVEQHRRTRLVGDRAHARRPVGSDLDPLRQHLGMCHHSPERCENNDGKGEPAAISEVHGRPFTEAGPLGGTNPIETVYYGRGGNSRRETGTTAKGGLAPLLLCGMRASRHRSSASTPLIKHFVWT